MDVELYVYDLSHGMARAMSMQFLGTQIDAVYHTSLVFGGIEYFFGAGVQTAYAGATHHGKPMQVVPMGQTNLPEEVILEYLESLKQIYTAESYDLFAHNCNNFTNDFSMFLVGKNIPSHITSLPETVLKTPFGQMLKPQIDQALRGVTQAPVPASNVPPTGATPTTNGTSGVSRAPPAGIVHDITSTRELDRLLEQAKTKCACIFFTSQTCPPCKIVYPTYDELAEEFAGQAVLIKVDISQAYEIANRYSIRATPTFITYLKGVKENEWSGASPPQLKGNVRMLVQAAFPPHPHDRLNIRNFLRQGTKPVVYSKLPPLEKLAAKMGPTAHEPAIKDAVTFVQKRNTDGAREAPLPDLPGLGETLRGALSSLPKETLFAAYDLFRLVLVDARASGFFAEEKDHCTLLQLLKYVNQMDDCPYNLRIVAIHVGCNVFSSPVMQHAIVTATELAGEMVTLVLSSLQDDQHSQIRVAASSLGLNLATAEHLARQEGRATLTGGVAYDLTACLCHGITSETESKEAIRGLCLGLGRMVYKADDELLDLVTAMEVGPTVLDKASAAGASQDDKLLLTEVGRELCGKGLQH